MSAILSGWLGYGTVIQSNLLVEPNDPAYIRRSIVFNDLDNGLIVDAGGGTVGPAMLPWGIISFAGIFDAQFSGNLLFYWALAVPRTILIGMTLSTSGGNLRLSFPDLINTNKNHVWPAGINIAMLDDGRLVFSGTAVQCSNRVFSAQSSIFGNVVTMAALPLVQPNLGTGQLWNNGGIISVA